MTVLNMEEVSEYFCFHHHGASNITQKILIFHLFLSFNFVDMFLKIAASGRTTRNGLSLSAQKLIKLAACLVKENPTSRRREQRYVL